MRKGPPGYIGTVIIPPTCPVCFHTLRRSKDKHILSLVCTNCDKIDKEQARDTQVLDSKSLERMIKNNRYEKPLYRKVDQLAIHFLKKDTWTTRQLIEITVEAETSLRFWLSHLIRLGLLEKTLCPCGNGFLYHKLEKKCPDCDMMMPGWSYICGGCYDKKKGKIRRK